MAIGKLSVAIVGGSIGGCAAAIELRRLGFDVTVFERSRNLEDRGAGITLTLSVLDFLRERDLVGAGLSFFPVRKRQFVVRSDEQDQRFGKTIWESPSLVDSTNWDVLYRELRQRVPNEVFRAGIRVEAVRNAHDGGELRLSDGTTRSFDLVVCADGNDSLGRKALFPDCVPRYAGYIAWRGIVPERLVRDMALFENVRLFAVYESGHAVFYMVPGPKGEVDFAKRRLNWVLYERVSEDNLEAALTDAHGTKHRSSLPPGAVTKDQRNHLQLLATRFFSLSIQEVIEATQLPFIQGIYDVNLPAYYAGRICLVGDAATLARPHVGAGTTKAIKDAVALAEALSSSTTMSQGLDTWSGKRCQEGNKLVAQGQALGRALVTETPDWATVNDLQMERIYESAIADVGRAR
ncbi:MAG: FAD-dependent monooxygenase [Burkholderiales bacterium]